MKATKLPSGRWRCRTYDNETKTRKSFTADTKKEAEYLAHQYLNTVQPRTHDKTVGKCIDDYIDSKKNILSPTTIESYRRKKKNNLAELCDIPLKKLTQADIQAHFNQLALTKSPKTVRDVHGLLVAVLHVYAPEMHIRTTLPKIQKHIKSLPEVSDVMKAVKGTDIELPCLLAMWGGMRMSEIRGAKKSDIHDGVLTIHDTVVTVDGQHIEKPQTKTVESTRQISLAEPIMVLINALPTQQDKLTLLSGQAIYKRFSRILEANGIPHMTFHDLRHMNASVMLALGVPDKYAMERGGWNSPHIMKAVYQHTFTKERKIFDSRIDEYFQQIYDAEEQE